MFKPIIEAKIQQQLQEEDRDFILRYREFEAEIRASKIDFLPPTHEQLMRCSERKPISVGVEWRDISAVVTYHEWACKRDEGYVPLIEILTSKSSFYEYIQWKVNCEDQQMRSQTMICNGVLRMLAFIEEMEEVDDDMKDAINGVRKTARVLLVRARSDAVRHAQERPSVDELREKGEMLSFHDLIKVCKKQKWRVKVLLKNIDRSVHHRPAMERMFDREALRLAVITMLLTRPLRKSELKKLTIDKSSKHWRAKLISNERKNRKSLNARLSRREKWVLHQLMPPKGNMWKPFQGVDPTNILSKITQEMTGVSMTIMDLRTAAESYAELDLADNKEIQDALNAAEGHTRQTAAENYSRNSQTNLMRPWKNHVEGLLYEEGCSNDRTLALDKMIEGKLEESSRKWKAKIERKINRLKEVAKQKQQKHKEPTFWTEKEDDELRRCVKLYSTKKEISWSRIMKGSVVLQKRYANSPDYRFKLNIRSRWTILIKNGEQKGRKGSKAKGKVTIRRRRKKRKIPTKHKVISNSATSETDNIFTVEKIIGYKKENGQDKYLIKWEGFNANYNTWEPSSNLNEAALEEAEEFQKQQNKTKKKKKRRLNK